MTRDEMKGLVEACTYKPGWTIKFALDDEWKPYFQIHVGVESDACLDSVKRDGSRTPWRTHRKWLSEFMCEQEVVGMVFGALKDAEMHEAHEWFRFQGASIYNPHLDPRVLAAVARKLSSFNVRQNAMTMEEG